MPVHAYFTDPRANQSSCTRDRAERNPSPWTGYAAVDVGFAHEVPQRGIDTSGGLAGEHGSISTLKA